MKNGIFIFVNANTWILDMINKCRANQRLPSREDAEETEIRCGANVDVAIVVT